ncbi:MAG: hypothetical protein WKG00_24135 [Polyangiaceae bacterium]
MLCEDRRGGTLAQYVIVLGLVALGALTGARVLGAAVRAKIEAQAACLDRLDCDGNPALGWPAPPPPPQGAMAALPAPAGDVDSTRLALAQRLVSPAGSGTDSDAALVEAELARLPLEVLQYMERNGITVKVGRGSVVEVYPELSGVQVLGWPEGETWDRVPGVGWNPVAIAIRDGRIPPQGDGHNSTNLVLHETFHAIDERHKFSQTEAFLAAYSADFAKLEPYYQEEREGMGAGEAFAESAARYYAGDPTLREELPHLFAYWEANHDQIFPKTP